MTTSQETSYSTNHIQCSQISEKHKFLELVGASEILLPSITHSLFHEILIPYDSSLKQGATVEKDWATMLNPSSWRATMQI